MHPTTQAVRSLYERFPYPAGPISLRMGFDVRRALANLHTERPGGRRLTVLDAGCGRGSGVLGMAIAQPGIDFVGIDISRASLAEARQQAQARGLHNVHLQEVDLETLEGLEIPDHGFDLIVSSGVIHHLVDPVAALRRLGALLAPWGALDLMVYARPGRVGIETVAAVLAAEIPEGPVEQRLAAARALVARRDEPAFVEARKVEDVEFVDRYLHPQFVSYTLEELQALVEGAGLALRRWTDPTQFPTPPLEVDPWAAGARAAHSHRPFMWSGLLSRPQVEARRPVVGAQVDDATWAINPEGNLARPVRTLWSGARAGATMWMPATGGASPLPGPLGDFLLDVAGPFRGRDLFRWLGPRGVPVDTARQWLLALERGDVLWRPHAVDLVERSYGASTSTPAGFTSAAGRA